jgi:hypothetical protein
MKILATILVSIILSIIICVLNYRVSGGDIFVLFMIISFFLIELLIWFILKTLFKRNVRDFIIGTILGFISSLIVFFIFNYFR